MLYAPLELINRTSWLLFSVHLHDLSKSSLGSPRTVVFENLRIDLGFLLSVCGIKGAGRKVFATSLALVARHRLAIPTRLEVSLFDTKAFFGLCMV